MKITVILWVFICSLGLSVSFGAAPTTGISKGKAKHVPWSGYFWSMEFGELTLGWDDETSGRKKWHPNQVRGFSNCIGKNTKSCNRRIAEMAAQKGRALSPLMKFDLFVRNWNKKNHTDSSDLDAYSKSALWELENHYIGSNRSHKFWDSVGFAGKCIGWALANLEGWDEPSIEKEIEGVVFTPADIKGILSNLYHGALFFVDDFTIGQEFRASHDLGTKEGRKIYDDVFPHHFMKALVETVGKGQILEADLDPWVGVWNYPIHEYHAKWVRDNSRRATKTGYWINVEVEIRYPDDVVLEWGLDYVFSKDKARPDLLTKTLTFDLRVPSNWDGDLTKATTGKWTGDSVDDHPDTIITGLEKGWYETLVFDYNRYDFEGTPEDPGEFNYEMLTVGSQEGVGEKLHISELLKAYYGSKSKFD